MRARRIGLCAVIVSVSMTLCSAIAQPAAAQNYTFRKIVDTTSALPGSSSLFSGFSDVCFDGTNISFIGASTAGEGVYLWNGSAVSTVADVGATVPSASGTFSDFANLSMDGGAVAFQGLGAGREGVYTTLGGTLRRVADTTMLMPGSTSTFADLFQQSTPSFDVAVDGDHIVFSGFGRQTSTIVNEGVYKESAGTLSRVADRSTVAQGATQSFVFFGEVDASQGHVVFDGDANIDGPFTTLGAPAGQVRNVAHRNTPLPGMTPPHSIFFPNSYSIDGNDIAFKFANGTTFNDSLFVANGGSFTRVVSEGDTNPVTNTGLAFLDGAYSLNGGKLLFSGWSSSGGSSIDTVFLWNGNSFAPVMSDLDTLDGKDLTDVNVYKESLRGDDFAFRAVFSDGSTGIYLAEAEPTTGPQTVTLLPTFDVNYIPGSITRLEDGETGLQIGGISGHPDFPEERVILEFPLATIPEDAIIESLHLVLDPYVSSGSPRIEIAGYAGDGLASLSDGTLSATVLEISPPTSVSTGADFTLDVELLQSLLGSASHLGLRLRSIDLPQYIGVASSEASFGDPKPSLMVTFTLPATFAGDFNGDESVDAADYLLWRKGYGTIYDEDDYADWRANFGETLRSSGRGAAVPEPAAASLVLVAMFGYPWGRVRRSPLSPQRLTTSD